MTFKEFDLETVKKLYRQLKLARVFEERVGALYTQGHIYGFCHLYIGQEAVIVGLSHNMQSQDSVITSYRDHVHMITLGVSPNAVMAELCGKAAGCSKGKGGSMHMYSKEHRFYGGNGIVGAQVPIGVGLGLSHKYKKDGGVSFTFYGDGAANQGQVYEAFNMASLWKLPVVFVLENNRYALGTSESRAAAGKNGLKNRGDPFGIETILIDGMDVFDVIVKSKKAIERVRGGEGPVILHMDTYRYRGHSISDPATYRTREEVENVKKTRDPVSRVKNELIKNFAIPETDITEIDSEVADIVNAAAEFAIKSEVPEAAALERDVAL
ncbi:MAG: pyruvate dehydrogenase (acetyl-transferring) E1 component subunit alpha [Holosporales bacterium]|jgi:pyruvate dehydrogenase E1 component alpha subunit|nr:pyruvate dehydrogenase (acetyl-transferring) E1 component subunit alpha [Holosporales bacterium]